MTRSRLSSEASIESICFNHITTYYHHQNARARPYDVARPSSMVGGSLSTLT